MKKTKEVNPKKEMKSLIICAIVSFGIALIFAIQLLFLSCNGSEKTYAGTYFWDFYPHSPDKQFVSRFKDDSIVYICDSTTTNCIKKLKGHSAKINDVDFSSDCKHLASASDDKTIKIWNINNEKCIKTLEGHTKKVNSIEYGSNGKRLASSSSDGTIRIWDIDSGKCIQTIKGYESLCGSASIAFSPNGKYLATSSPKGRIDIWDINNGKCIQTLKGHIDGIMSMDFSPNNKHLVSVDWEGMMVIWNVKTGLALKTYKDFYYCHTRVKYSSDGKSFLSQGANIGGWVTKKWNAEVDGPGEVIPEKIRDLYNVDTIIILPFFCVFFSLFLAYFSIKEVEKYYNLYLQNKKEDN